MLSEEHRAMLTLLDDHESWAHGQHLLTGPNEVLFAGQQLRFAVVEHQAVDAAQQGEHFFALNIDPQIHRVGHGQRGARHLVEHLALQRRAAVGEKQIF